MRIEMVAYAPGKYGKTNKGFQRHIPNFNPMLEWLLSDFWHGLWFRFHEPAYDEDGSYKANIRLLLTRERGDYAYNIVDGADRLLEESVIHCKEGNVETLFAGIEQEWNRHFVAGLEPPEEKEKPKGKVVPLSGKQNPLTPE